MIARHEDVDGGAVAREAFILPLLFFTVCLGGGFRAGVDGGSLRFIAPPLFSLVLAMLVVGTLHRAGALSTDRLMRLERTGLENLSGLVVLVSVFAATAQLLNLLTPETGLLRLIVNLFFLVLLWTMMTAEPDSTRLLRSLLVVFLSTFVLKYILFASLADPEGGLTKRVVAILLEGATLGTLDYQREATITGYVAFFTVVLYLIGLALLPKRPAARLRQSGPDTAPLRLPPGTVIAPTGSTSHAAGGTPAAGALDER